MNPNGCHLPSPAALPACGKQIHTREVQSAQQERDGRAGRARTQGMVKAPHWKLRDVAP